MRYTDPDPRHRPHGLRAVLRWGVLDRLTGRRHIEPPGPPAPRVEPDIALVHDLRGAPRLTWIGHASFLGSAGGAAFLIDPHLSGHAGRIYQRFVEAGLGPSDLPPLEALLITHNHYDHLDAASVDGLPRTVPVLVPLGLGRWFRRRGFTRVSELGWWETAEAGPIRATLVPARHWSRRSPFDTNRTLWGGFVVDAGGARFYHAGDSARFDGFAEIGVRFPGILAAMLPIGAYAPAWFMEHYHLNPEQAGEAFRATRARWLVPMHWGVFKLTDEPLCAPVDRLRAWWSAAPGLDDRRLWVPAVGATKVFDD